MVTLTEVRNESKRTGKSFEQIFKEKTGREVRKPEFRTQTSFVKRALTAAKSWFNPFASDAIDAENRRTLAALGNRIAQEKRRDDLRRRLYPTPAEQEQDRVRENLAEARRIGRELLGE